MANSNKLVTGLIAGVVIGAVAGLLLAPKSGKETRKFLKERASQIGKKAGLNNMFTKGQAGEEAETSPTNGSARRGH